MRIRYWLPLGVLAVTAAACSDPAAPAGSRAPSFNGDGPLHQVIGSGHVEQAAGLREFTFHALENPDGSMSGSYQIVLPSGLFFEADVTCLAVAGTTGWIAGTIRATNAAPVVLGSVSTVYVIDDGEGPGSSDIVSTATFNGAAGADLAFCANRPLVLPPFAVTNGNVQVR
jgi:hypothetical protein